MKLRGASVIGVSSTVVDLSRSRPGAPVESALFSRSSVIRFRRRYRGDVTWIQVVVVDEEGAPRSHSGRDARPEPEPERDSQMTTTSATLGRSDGASVPFSQTSITSVMEEFGTASTTPAIDPESHFAGLTFELI